MASLDAKIKPNLKTTSGQVVLETAIVLISVAVIAVSSMALFSNINLNLIDRMDIFKQSRLAAVNNIVSSTLPGNALNPLTYLDYSPHTSIVIPSDGGDTGIFDPLFYEDPRITQVELRLDEADNIMNVVLPYKTSQAYQLLGGNGNSYYYILTTVSKQEVIKAKKLCDEMVDDAKKAYDNFFGPEGAVALLQEVLDQPQIPGPFDYEEEHQTNREQLQAAINSINLTKQGLNETLNNQFIPRVQSASNNLRLALLYWRRHLWTYPRVSYIVRAKEPLKEIMDFIGEVENPTLSDNLARQIQAAYNLLGGEANYTEAVQAKDTCFKILQNPEINTKDTPALKSLMQGAYNALNNALKNWDKPDLKAYYLDLAREKLEVLDDIAEI